MRYVSGTACGDYRRFLIKAVNNLKLSNSDSHRYIPPYIVLKITHKNSYFPCIGLVDLL